MKSIQPIGEVSRQGPAAANAPDSGMAKSFADTKGTFAESAAPPSLTPEMTADAPLSGELSQTSPLSGAGVLPKSGPSYYAPRPAKSVQGVVNDWATRVSAEAPARHHRDFGEYMLERLPELIAELEKL